jgi:hypothetical protein
MDAKVGMMAAPAMDIDSAPPELREPLRRAMAQINRDLSAFKLKSPDTETLQKMVDAGAGEHRDRLFSSAVKEAMSQLFDDANDTVRGYIKAYKATKEIQDKDAAERFFS